MALPRTYQTNEIKEKQVEPELTQQVLSNALDGLLTRKSSTEIFHRRISETTHVDRSISSDNDPEHTSSSSSELESYSYSDALQRLVEQWADIAISHAIVRDIEDPDGLIARVVGIKGAWGFGQSADEALAELRTALIDWASIKLEDGDDDIPSMEGVHLVLPDQD